MLTMQVVKSAEELETIAAQAGISADGLACYAAKDNHGLIGYCLYRPESYGLSIVKVEYGEDVGLFDGLVRATMALLFDCAKDRVSFSENVDIALLQRFGFVQENDLEIPSANAFFTGKKSCEN